MAFNPATSLRNFIKNSPWVFMAIAVHVIALSVLAIVQFAKQAPKPEETITTVKIAQKQETPPEDTLPPEVLDRKACEKLGMGSFLSVAHGSEEPPKFIVAQYRGGAENCGFYSFRQCLAGLSGSGGQCVVAPIQEEVVNVYTPRGRYRFIRDAID